MNGLEEMCAWKRVAEREFVLRRVLRHCNLCDGYKLDCKDYRTTGDGRKRLSKGYRKI